MSDEDNVPIKADITLSYPGFNVDIPFTETFKMNFGFNVGINTLVNDLGRRNITYSLVFGTNF